MRKVKLSMQMTINGYVAGPNGENDWMTWNPDPEFLAFLSGTYEAADTLLLGRKLVQGGFIHYWESVLEKNADAPFAKQIVGMKKIVFSKTLSESSWNNTVLAKGDIAAEVANLKSQPGKDIIVLGGADFVSSLIKEGLIDEYQLIINPTAMAHGKPIFNALDGIHKFTPVAARLFPGGKTVLVYQPKTD